MMKNNMTELVFILDRSGSMAGLESDTIGGFNSMNSDTSKYQNSETDKNQNHINIQHNCIVPVKDGK